MLDTGRPGEWDSGGAYSLDVIQSRDGFHIWYAGNAPRKDGKRNCHVTSRLATMGKERLPRSKVAYHDEEVKNASQR